MRWSVVLFATCTLLWAPEAQAQDDFTATGLKPGDRVDVTRSSGSQLRGVVTDVSPTVLTVDGNKIQPDDVLRAERLGDPIWGGAAIGFVTGVVLGASTPRRGCIDGATALCVLGPGLIFGALGAWIDRAHVGRKTVFVGRGSPSAALVPVVSAQCKALLLGFSF